MNDLLKEEFEIKETHTTSWGEHFLTHIEIRNIESLPAALKRLTEMGYDLSEAREVLQVTAKDQPKMNAEELAKFFHEEYECFAVEFDHSVSWGLVPATNKNLMIAVAAEILKRLGVEQ